MLYTKLSRMNNLHQHVWMDWFYLTFHFMVYSGFTQDSVNAQCGRWRHGTWRHREWSISRLWWNRPSAGKHDTRVLLCRLPHHQDDHQGLQTLIAVAHKTIMYSSSLKKGISIITLTQFFIVKIILCQAEDVSNRMIFWQSYNKMCVFQYRTLAHESHTFDGKLVFNEKDYCIRGHLKIVQTFLE